MVCLWICAGSVGYGIAALFAKRAAIRRTRRILANAPQFGERATFSRQKAPQSLNCGALQDGALRRGHQSAAHTVGEKWCTWRRVFTCRRGAFVAFFLTYIVYVYILVNLCVCVCVSVCLSVCLPVCLSACLPACVSLSLSISLITSAGGCTTIVFFLYHHLSTLYWLSVLKTTTLS